MLRGDNPARVDIAYRRARCLHAKSPWFDCDLCYQSCPSGAIHHLGGSKAPVFDVERCLHCGACLAACPQEAFTTADFSERKAVRRMAAEGSTRLRCFLPYGELSALSSGMSSYQLGTCLAALSPGALFEVAREHSCTLDTDHCRSCNLHRIVGGALARNIHAADQLLGDWGLSGNLVDSASLVLDADSSTPDPSVRDTSPHFRLPEGEEKGDWRDEASPFDRKAALHGLFRRMRSARFGTIDSGNTGARSIECHRSSWRSALADIWREAEPGETAGGMYPWPIQVVDGEACIACGVCRQLCPSGAIRQVLRAGMFIYLFTPGFCIECGLCDKVCLQHALIRMHGADPHPFDETACHSREAEACVRCGGPALAGSSVRGYCRQCAIELGMISGG